MSRLKKLGIRPVLGFILLAFLSPASASSADLDAIGSGSAKVNPNVLIILDISGSMSYTDTKNASNVTSSRINVAKQAIIKMINDNPDVRWGLMVFPATIGSTVYNGRIVEECKDRTPAQLTSLTAQINSLSVNGGTPVASALAEAGLYFSGQNSFFWRAANTPKTAVSQAGMEYTTPIKNECQANYIILLTDGFASVDSGIVASGGYYNTNSTSKYDFASRNDSIFLTNYLNGIRIEGNKDTNNSGFYGYITWKTHYAPPAQRDATLGLKLAEYVLPFWWTPEDNNLIRTRIASISDASLSISANSSPYINWSRTLSGNPLGLGTTNVMTLSKVNALRYASPSARPFMYGYNAADPSRPVPPLPIAYSSTTLTATTSISLNEQGYIQNSQLFQGNQWAAGYFGSDYLDDVAALLANEDLLPNMGIGTKYEKQSVKTYVVGFMFSSDLLERTAVMGGTGKEGYMQASSAEELDAAFNDIITGISQELNMMAMPSLPTASGNDNYTGNVAYLGLFKPTGDKGWLGNLKRYTLDKNHTLGENGDGNGMIKDTAKSDWSLERDGNDIEKGGAAAALKKQAEVSNFYTTTRNVYTYLEGYASTDLTTVANKFHIDNKTNLTNYGLPLGSYSNINDLIISVRQQPFGAVIHSSAQVARYGSGSSNTVVFVGTNEGFLHALDDTNGYEKWVFIMPEHLSTIHLAGKEFPVDDRWFVDGAITIKQVELAGLSEKKQLLVFGSRRGGRTYVGLDVSIEDKPYFVFEIDEEFMGSSMGQSWATPMFKSVHSGFTGYTVDSSSTCVDRQKVNAYEGKHNIVILAGGYDPRYDKMDQINILDADGGPVQGAGITAVNLSNNSYPAEETFSLLNAQASGNIMKHSILSVAAADMNNDGMVDSLYFGDQGGYMFHALLYNIINTGESCGKSYKMSLVAKDKFTPYVFFRASGNNAVDQRKIQYAPDVVREKNSEYVYFGTGDRENPTDRVVHDRFYCVKINDYARYETSLNSNGNPLGAYQLEDLVDITENLIKSNNDEIKNAVQKELDEKNGWYLDLLPAEKVVTSPIVFDEMVFFNTYTPNESNEIIDPTDVCVGGSDGGVARTYALNYLNGSGVGLDGYDDQDGRAKIIGNSIPSQVVLAIFEDGEVVVMSSVMDTPTEPDDPDDNPKLPQDNLGNINQPNMFYWRQIF